MKLICYLSNGYPTFAESQRLAREYVYAGCDIIEIDIPSRNPYLESDYISERMKYSLHMCGDYDKYLENLKTIKSELSSTTFILVVYEETILEIGIQKFIVFCTHNDYKDIILVGIKHQELKSTLIKNGLYVSCYIQFRLPKDEIDAAKNSNGFVYLQSKPYVNNNNLPFLTLKECIQYLREIYKITVPIYCGVGIHTPQDAQMVKEASGDGVFVGSTILKLYNNIPDMKLKIQEFKDACQ